jgi:hypothetical protein
VLVDEIPKNPGGKVAKGVVRERWGLVGLSTD